MIRRFLSIAVFSGFLWWIFTGGDPHSWVVGIPVVLLAASVRMMVPPGGSSSFSIRGWLGLIPTFLWQSLLGGWDVARRVFSPRLPIDPVFFEFRLGLQETASRWFFINLINLTPGTLSARLVGEVLLIHTLDSTNVPEKGLRETERRVAAAFGETPTA